jgi:hypothetical protein
LDDDGESKETTHTLVRKKDTKNKQVIVVLGPSGSGVLSLYSQLMERLESNQNFSNFRTQILDLACGETKIFKLLSSLDTCPEGTLILIGLITSPVTHISSDDILRRLQASAGMNIASCINVVQPQAFLRSPNVSRYASSVSSPLSSLVVPSHSVTAIVLVLKLGLVLVTKSFTLVKCLEKISLPSLTLPLLLICGVRMSRTFNLTSN